MSLTATHVASEIVANKVFGRLTRSPLLITASIVAMAWTTTVIAQEATPPNADLPPVTVDSTPESQAQQPPAAQVKKTQSQASTKAKASASKKAKKAPPAPPLEAVEAYEPAEAPVESSAATTTSTTGQGRGGPSGVDGYQATRSFSVGRATSTRQSAGVSFSNALKIQAAVFSSVGRSRPGMRLRSRWSSRSRTPSQILRRTA